MVQAEAQQGVAQQPVGLDGVVADLANAERSAVEPRQSFVHAEDELADRGVRNARASRRLQARPASLEFGVEIRMSSGVRVCHAESLLLCAWGIHPFCASKFNRFTRGNGNQKRTIERRCPPPLV